MNTAVMQRQRCVFNGRVQGVGFRYTVQNLALQYDVAGYVRNLPDGRAELVMEGPEEAMAALLENIRNKMNAYIKKVDIETCPATGQFARFCIRH
ncbi:MAG: acylphosphatase [Tepidisphaeraceae bacterium]|jgi:acylphosphatase